VIIYDGERTTMQDVEIPDEMIGIDVPLKRLAEEAGGAIMRNVVALGAACEVAEFPIENLDSALEKRFADKGQKLVDNNKEAARAGQSYVDEEYDHEFDYDLRLLTRTTSSSTATRPSGWAPSRRAAASTPATRSRPRPT